MGKSIFLTNQLSGVPLPPLRSLMGITLVAGLLPGRSSDAGENALLRLYPATLAGTSRFNLDEAPVDLGTSRLVEAFLGGPVTRTLSEDRNDLSPEVLHFDSCCAV